MGSFNTTCAVSRAPIREGNKVRLFYVVSEGQVIGKGGECYPWDNFKIIGGGAIPAEYADFNNYDFDEDSLFAKYIQNYIKQEYSENISIEGEEYNDCHDHMDVNVKDLTWQKIQEMVRSGRLFLKDFQGEKCFVAAFVIHESVYQVMIHSKETIDAKIKEVLSCYNNMMGFKEAADINKARLEADVESGKITFEQQTDIANKIAFESIAKTNLNKIKFSFIGQAVSNVSGSKVHKEVITFAKNNGFEKAEEEVFRALAETERLLETMLVENVMIRPIMTSGQGGQAKDTASFLRHLADAVESIKVNWEDDDVGVNVEFCKESKEWQQVKLSNIKTEWEETSDIEDEEYAYLCEIIEGKDKLIISPEEWDNGESFYNVLADVIGESLDTSIELHILNQ